MKTIDREFPKFVAIPGMGRKSAAEIDAMPDAVRRVAADALRSFIDIEVQNHGSVVLLVPHSESAKEFFDERIGHANGYQPYWPTVVVEPRYVESIIEGARAEGLVLN